MHNEKLPYAAVIFTYLPKTNPVQAYSTSSLQLVECLRCSKQLHMERKKQNEGGGHAALNAQLFQHIQNQSTEPRKPATTKI